MGTDQDEWMPVIKNCYTDTGGHWWNVSQQGITINCVDLFVENIQSA